MVCGLLLADDPDIERMEFFSCTVCDANKMDFYIACHQCVRARWPEPMPADYPFVILLPELWSVGCLRCAHSAHGK